MPRHSSRIPVRKFEEFVGIVRRLRKECPWDREQTHATLRDMLIEEAYEVVETIDEHDAAGLRNELGDILLHIVMHATIAEERGTFTLREVFEGITSKLIRRHPHVFGTRIVRNASDVRKNWHELKMAEGRASVLEGIPKGLPALQRALNVQERASRVGFDWKERDDVWKKVVEELAELREVLQRRSFERKEEELGDFLFAIVNYSRFVGINPERALRRATTKFMERFHDVESALRRRGKAPGNSTLEEMDALWNRAKRRTMKKRRRIRGS